MEKKESNHFALDKVWESCWLWTKLRNWAICRICAAAGKKKSRDVAPPRGRWQKPLLRLLSTAFPTSLKIHSSLTARAWWQMRRRRPLYWVLLLQRLTRVLATQSPLPSTRDTSGIRTQPQSFYTIAGDSSSILCFPPSLSAAVSTTTSVLKAQTHWCGNEVDKLTLQMHLATLLTAPPWNTCSVRARRAQSRCSKSFPVTGGSSHTEPEWGEMSLLSWQQLLQGDAVPLFLPPGRHQQSLSE